MAITSDQNDTHHQGCCTVWFLKFVSICSFGSSDDQNDDDDHDRVITDRIEDIRRPLILNQSTVGNGSFWLMTAIDQNKSEESNHEKVDADNDQIQFHQSENECAFRLAARLSSLIVDFVLLIPDQQGVIKVFGQFKAFLEPKSRERENLMVVNRILALLETAEEELRKRTTKSKSHENFDRNKHFFDAIVDRFCDQISKLEAFMTSQSVSELLMLTEAVLDNMIGILDQCKAELDSIQQEIFREKEKVSSTKSDDDCDQILKKEMVLRVKELWSGLGSF